MNRNIPIDIFRAIAIILITGYHVTFFINHPTKPFLIFDFYAPFNKGSVGVALFVFISGYITHAFSFKLSVKDFIKKRLLRVSVPYYAAILIINILLYCHVLMSATPGLIDNLTHLLYIHNLFPRTYFTISGQYWYLALQMQLYLVYLLVRPYIQQRYLYLAITAFLITILTNMLMPCLFSKYAIYSNVVLKSVFSYFFIFLLGAIIKEREGAVIPILQKPFIFYSLIIISLAWLYLNKTLINSYELDCMGIGLTLGLVMLGMPELNPDQYIVSSLSIIGKASYSIFLYNFIFWVFAPQLYFIRGLFVYTFITIAFGMAMYFFVEEPLNKVIKNFA